MSNSVILSNGDVDIGKNHVIQSVIITTGSVIGIRDIDNSVIVCSGDVKLDTRGHSSIVRCGGAITCQANGETWKDGDGESSVRQHDAKFFDAWKLYSAAEAGATLRGVFGLVWVQTVRPQSPFAAAGVEPGEFVTAVNGTPVRTVRDAERLLCRATVTWGGADLTLARGGKTRDVIVTLQEW